MEERGPTTVAAIERAHHPLTSLNVGRLLPLALYSSLASQPQSRLWEEVVQIYHFAKVSDALRDMVTERIKIRRSLVRHSG